MKKFLMLFAVLTIVTIPLKDWRSLDEEQKMKAIGFFCLMEARENNCYKVVFRVHVNDENATIQTQCAEDI